MYQCSTRVSSQQRRTVQAHVYSRCSVYHSSSLVRMKRGLMCQCSTRVSSQQRRTVQAHIDSRCRVYHSSSTCHNNLGRSDRNDWPNIILFPSQGSEQQHPEEHEKGERKLDRRTVSEIEENLRKNNSKRVYQLVTDLTTVKQGKSTTVQDRSGKCLTEEREILNRCSEYCSELYNHKVNGDSSVLNCPQTHTQRMTTLSFAKKWRQQYNPWRKGSQLDSTSQQNWSKQVKGCTHRSHDNLRQDVADRRMANPMDPVLSPHTS